MSGVPVPTAWGILSRNGVRIMTRISKFVLGVIAILFGVSTIGSASSVCVAGPIYSYWGTCTYGGVEFTFSNAQALDIHYNFVTGADSMSAYTGVTVTPYLSGNNVGFTFSSLPETTVSGNNLDHKFDAWLMFTATPLGGSIVGTGAFVTDATVSAWSDSTGIQGSGSAIATTWFDPTSSTRWISSGGPYAYSRYGTRTDGIADQGSTTACSGCTPFSGYMSFELDTQSYRYQGGTYVTTGQAGGSAGAQSGTTYVILGTPSQPVPEPASLLLALPGLLPIVFRRLWR